MLMARYAVDAAKVGAKALRINGIINIAFGVVGLVAVVVVSPWGPMKHPVWMQIELYKCVLAAVAFFVWALMGWLSIKSTTPRWTLAALCPMGLALLVGFAIPDRVTDSKQPQFLVDIVSESLTPSRYVLSNNVGIAAGLAWELNRSDVIMYSQTGELKYGLSYPDAKGRFISSEDFPQWLEAHRQEGPISLVLQLQRNTKVVDLPLPKPDEVYVMGRTAFIQYRPQ